MLVKGEIVAYDGDTITIQAPFPNQYLLEKQEIEDVEIRLNDGRTISNKQRRKIFALVSDIGEYTSSIKDRKEYTEMLRELKLLYVIDLTDNEVIRRMLTSNYCNLTDMDMFSLSDCDMTTARGFIDWLIEMCIKFKIPCNDSLLNLCEDVGRYLYLCVANRMCCICGDKADIHEVEKVGMGRNRQKMHHSGQLVQPLCRLHHMEEEQLGQRRFNEKYHLQPITLDDYLCKCIGWKK